MEDIKILREQSGAGMVDCKTALEEAVGDLDKAVEILRKKGIAKAAKRGDRQASEGLILVDVNSERKEGYILEVNSETDFVARNEQFQDLARLILKIISQKKPSDLNELMEIKIIDSVTEAAAASPAETVGERLANLSGTIGEKLGVKRFAVLTSSGTVAAYSHLGGKIGVLAALDRPNQEQLVHDIALQVAAADPRYLKPADVPQQEIDKEKEIYREQLKKEGKPDEIIEKIVPAKLNKYFEEVCLVKQEFIKDEEKKVEDILGEAKVEKFIRYSL